MDRRWLWIGAAALLLAVFFGVRAMTREKLAVRAAEAVRQDLVSTISTNGKVEPQVNFEAHSPLAAVVKSRYVREGDRVAKGQLLLQMDDTEARSRVATALAAMRGAQAGLDAITLGGTQEERVALSGELSKAKLERDQAARDLAALERLQAGGSASASEVAAARQRLQVAESSLHVVQQRQSSRYAPIDLEHAQANLADARASYQAAEEVLRQANVRAPFAGTVYSLPVSATEFVEQGKLLLQIADLGRIQVRAYFDEPELGKLAAGQPITIVWDAKPGRVWRGHVAYLPSTIITYGTRNVGEVLVAVDDSDGVLLPGTNVTVTVTTSNVKNALSVPREALHSESGNTFVYRVQNNAAVRTPVKVGAINLTQVEIQSGLAEHEIVALGSANGQPIVDGVALKVVK